MTGSGCNHPDTQLRRTLLFSGSALMVRAPSFQSAGQTSPLVSKYCSAWTILKVSSTLAQRQIIDDLMANHAIFVYQEQSTQGNATGKRTSGPERYPCSNRRQADNRSGQFHLEPRRVPPCKVTEVTVDGDAQQLNPQSFDFDPIRKGNDLGRANK